MSMGEFRCISTHKLFPYVYLGTTYRGKDKVPLSLSLKKKLNIKDNRNEISARELWARLIVIPQIRKINLGNLKPDQKIAQISHLFRNLPITANIFDADTINGPIENIEKALIERVIWIKGECWIDVSETPKPITPYEVFKNSQQIYLKETKKVLKISSLWGVATLSTILFSLIRFISFNDENFTYYLSCAFLSIFAFTVYYLKKFFSLFPANKELKILEQSIHKGISKKI